LAFGDSQEKGKIESPCVQSVNPLFRDRPDNLFLVLDYLLKPCGAGKFRLWRKEKPQKLALPGLGL
jgi:hypothetical protein